MPVCFSCVTVARRSFKLSFRQFFTDFSVLRCIVIKLTLNLPQNGHRLAGRSEDFGWAATSSRRVPLLCSCSVNTTVSGRLHGLWGVISVAVGMSLIINNMYLTGNVASAVMFSFTALSLNSWLRWVGSLTKLTNMVLACWVRVLQYTKYLSVCMNNATNYYHNAWGTAGKLMTFCWRYNLTLMFERYDSQSVPESLAVLPLWLSSASNIIWTVECLFILTAITGIVISIVTQNGVRNDIDYKLYWHRLLPLSQKYYNFVKQPLRKDFKK